MWTTVIYVSSAAALLLAVWVVVSAFRVRRHTRLKEQQLDWIRQQSVRALEMVKSSDDSQVIAGLQTLSALKERKSRLAALNRVVELTKSENPAVAEHAEATFREIVPSDADRRANGST
jgi:hypothetical protein